MGKKRKKQRESGGGATAAVAVPASPEPAPATIRWGLIWREVTHQPVLLAAGLATMLTLFGIYGAVRFAHDISMGAMREPHGILFCAAIAFVLFASYWRESRRGSGDGDGADG